MIFYARISDPARAAMTRSYLWESSESTKSALQKARLIFGGSFVLEVCSSLDEFHNRKPVIKKGVLDTEQTH
jgi:hypothetical protein